MHASANVSATSCPCLASLGHLTADKREIKDCPKLPSATSFIRKPLGKIRGEGNGRDTV